MTEKEKNVLQQELWALAALDADATKHLLAISARQFYAGLFFCLNFHKYGNIIIFFL